MLNKNNKFLAVLMGIFFTLAFSMILEGLTQAVYYLKHGHTYAESILYLEDSERGYRHNQAYRGKTYPDMFKGFRTKAFDFSKIQSKTKIICVGSSTTFGYSVNAGEYYPALLQANFDLKAKNREWFVLNAGINGYNIYLIEKYLPELVQSFKPSYVILSNVYNNINIGGGAICLVSYQCGFSPLGNFGPS